MQTKYQLIDNLQRLKAKLKDLKLEEQRLINEILEDENELESFDKKANLILKNFNHNDIKIRKVIYDDYNEPFKIHFNYKNERYFIKESYDDLYTHEIAVYKVYENKHHSIVKVEMLITSNISTPLKVFIQDKAYSHYDRKSFIETFIGIFGIDFFKS